MDSTVIVRLKERRVGAGLSQQALASRAGISRQALSAIEGGHQNPSVQVALGLSRALGCRVEDLFSLEAASVIEVEVEPGVWVCRSRRVVWCWGAWVGGGWRTRSRVRITGLATV